MIKKLQIVMALLVISFMAVAQISLPPSGDNQRSEVIQWVGLVKVRISYSSPDVHGPNGDDRKGKIWGEVVHYGFIDQGFGTSKAAPWRAGANENTTISFSHDVKIVGKDVKAGTYGLFLDVEKEGPWNWILSKDINSWGSYYYNPDSDIVRVQATPQECEYTEWLTYTFTNRKRNAAEVSLQWENKRVSFSVEVPNTNELYIAALRNELRGTIASFRHESYIAAASFCAQNKVELEQGLQWADYAITDGFVGREDFTSLSTKAQVLTAMGRDSEVEVIMDKAIKHPTASVNAVHQYARTLLAAGKKEKAMEVFKYNFKAHPEDKFTPNVGLARGYTALGDKKNAIKHWEAAIKNLPENQKQNLPFYEGELKKLKEG
jgi:tetratricopeptide (TPR) repeat protein